MKNYIEFKADCVRFYVMKDESIVDEQFLSIGSQTIVDQFFKQALTTEMETENAINFIEDEIMRHKALIHQNKTLISKDLSLNIILDIHHEALHHFSRQDVEVLFNQYARVLRREPSQMVIFEWTSHDFAKVLMLREIMHHINFEVIAFET